MHSRSSLIKAAGDDLTTRSSLSYMDTDQVPSVHETAPTLAHQTASLAWWLWRPPRERKIPGLIPRPSHTNDLKIGNTVATLPGAWRYWVSAGTVWPGVSIL